MRFLTRSRPGLVLLGLAAAVAAAVAVPASASAAASPVVGHLYVNDNTAGTNTIAGFDRRNDGTLTPMAGSPFAAGGAGAGRPASQGSLQSSPDGRFLLAVDAASNQISVLRIHGDGSLDRSRGRSRRTASTPSASRSTATWSTSPTPERAGATTRASA